MMVGAEEDNKKIITFGKHYSIWWRHYQVWNWTDWRKTKNRHLWFQTVSIKELEESFGTLINHQYLVKMHKHLRCTQWSQWQCASHSDNASNSHSEVTWSESR